MNLSSAALSLFVYSAYIMVLVETVSMQKM